MPDFAAFDEPSAPILSIADGRAVVRLNRPRQHNRIEPQDLMRLNKSSPASMPTPRSGFSC